MSTPAGLVNALVIWASGNTERTAELVAERDALVTGFLSGGKANKTMIGASANGKTFNWSSDMTRDEKLAALSQALVTLGAATNPVHSISFGDFRCASR